MELTATFPSHFVFFINVQLHTSGFCRDERWDAFKMNLRMPTDAPLSCRGGGASSAPREQWSQTITKYLKHFPLKSRSKLDRNQIRNRNIYCTTKCDFRCTEPHKKINQIALESCLLVLLCFIIAEYNRSWSCTLWNWFKRKRLLTISKICISL